MATHAGWPFPLRIAFCFPQHRRAKSYAYRTASSRFLGNFQRILSMRTNDFFAGSQPHCNSMTSCTVGLPPIDDRSCDPSNGADYHRSHCTRVAFLHLTIESNGACIQRLHGGHTVLANNMEHTVLSMSLVQVMCNFRQRTAVVDAVTPIRIRVVRHIPYAPNHPPPIQPANARKLSPTSVRNTRHVCFTTYLIRLRIPQHQRDLSRDAGLTLSSPEA